MASHRVVAGAVVIVTVMLLVFLEGSASAQERRTASSRGRSSSPYASPRGSNRYQSLCPEMRCPPVSSDCEMIEGIVLQFPHDVRGRGIVTVSCHSCPYCMDVPDSFAARGIRGYGNGQAVREPLPCSRFECPSLPENCNHIRLTDALVNGQLCDQCLACFDQTFFNLL